MRAVNEALDQCLSEDERVVILGEDVGAFGGAFSATRGLYERYGEKRLVDTPISEASLVGLGIGAAATGLVPIIEIMFMDFIALAMDQIANQMAKMNYMFGGGCPLPLTIRTPAGPSGSSGAQHSQSLEAWLCHIPGLKVVMPSGPYESKGLLMAAIRDNNPTIVLESKRGLRKTAHVPSEPYELPIGQANVVREGSDMTIVALGYLVSESLKAAERFKEMGISVEVIDPRSLQPFDFATVLQSVSKTHHCLVAHEAVRFGGLGAEVAAQVQELGFDDLDAPVHRVGAPFAPTPFSPVLERAYVPDASTIYTEGARMMGVIGGH
jgi:pyruvate dehydrogenase E1 component beta subunit